MKASLVFYIMEGHKALHKAEKAIDNQTTMQCNKLKHLENPIVIYGVYNVETENLTHTVHSMHNSTIEIERLFAGELNATNTWYINAPSTQECATESLLYFRTVRHKYIQMYKEFITKCCIIFFYQLTTILVAFL